MASGDGNGSRLLLAVVDDPAWKDDAPRLVVGMLQRQRQGHWLTTTANLWGTLAVNVFSKRFERDGNPSGTTRAAIAAGPALDLAWADKPQGDSLLRPWPATDAAAHAARRVPTFRRNASG